MVALSPPPPPHPETRPNPARPGRGGPDASLAPAHPPLAPPFLKKGQAFDRPFSTPPRHSPRPLTPLGLWGGGGGGSPTGGRRRGARGVGAAPPRRPGVPVGAPEDAYAPRPTRGTLPSPYPPPPPHWPPRGGVGGPGGLTYRPLPRRHRPHHPIPLPQPRGGVAALPGGGRTAGGTAKSPPAQEDAPQWRAEGGAAARGRGLCTMASTRVESKKVTQA